jgi:hypothetical protein
MHSTQANNSEALLLDFAKPSESVCVQTAFRMYNRVGVAGASGEISRKSVFTQNVNFLWQVLKPVGRKVSSEFSINLSWCLHIVYLGKEVHSFHTLAR